MLLNKLSFFSVNFLLDNVRIYANFGLCALSNSTKPNQAIARWKIFLKDLPVKQSKKIAWTLRVVRDLEKVPTQYLKKLKSTDDVWEVRATIGNNSFRLLGFFDGPKLIVLTSGFAKKSNKVPKQEIETAEERKRNYYRRKGQ